MFIFCFQQAESAVPAQTRQQRNLPAENKENFLRNARKIQQNGLVELLREKNNFEAARSLRSAVPADGEAGNDRLTASERIRARQAARLDGAYVLSSQFLEKGHPAHGAINNVFGDPTWIVPRENALAILALIESAELLRDPSYLARAQAAADYLVRVQDADGGWYDQYSYENPVVFSKSPTQTAEVMIALSKLGYTPARYEAMKKGADFLMACQDPANKKGPDDGLLGGGKNAVGEFQTWRWASDNSFAYWALVAAREWAISKFDVTTILKTNQAALKVLKGINDFLYIDDPNDPDYGVWRRAIDENHNLTDPGFHEWINYAPQMLDLPARGVGSQRVGEWIHKTLQKEDGAVVWNDGNEKDRKSPGFSFQAILVWEDLGQTQYSRAALRWARRSGLWQRLPDANGVRGGWIDWTENGTAAPFWQRFIDTSFYSIAAFKGGYDFRIKRR